MVGALAEDWEISPDGKQYTFHVNKASRFASGKPVTAEDVRFSLMRLKNVSRCWSWPP
ncbi:MAG: ABC transporter substrate-binding protein [Bacillota bacterium]|nr:ABC transporter substrate-binding protein [Bacillota bacterium]MDI7249918.1 ABC transporter substrate-binding protein [Bacillota bacterium]